MSINDLFSATLNSLRRGSVGRREERAKATADVFSGGGGGGVGEWTHKQVRRYFKRLQLDEYVGALRRAKIDGARLVALHNQDQLYATLGVTKIGHKKKLMVALRSLQEQGAWPCDLEPVQPLAADHDMQLRPASAVTTKHADSLLRSSTVSSNSATRSLKARRAIAAAATAAELDQQHNRSTDATEGIHGRGRKHESESASDKNASPPVPVLPLPDWAKLQRSRSGPDDGHSALDGAGDSPRKLSPRPATTRTTRWSPRQPHPNGAIWRSASRTPLQTRDLSSSSLPHFGSSVVPAVSAVLHDTASHSPPAASMPVSPAGSHIYSTFTSSCWTQSDLGFTAPTTAVRQRQQPATCTTLAYSQAFGGVAVKCVYGEDVSMIRFAQGIDCDTSTESGDDSDSGSDSEDSDDDDGDTQKTDKLRFVNLHESIRTTYGRSLRVKYVDRDGDAINIDSDASLNYAFNDWRGRSGEGSSGDVRAAATTSWRLHLCDFDESSSSLSSSSSTASLSSSSSFTS